MPITCDELFKTVESNTDPNLKHCVSFSMLEIYNECVRDLLIKNNPKGGLAVSQIFTNFVVIYSCSKCFNSRTIRFIFLLTHNVS